MAKPIVVSHMGAESSFQFSKLERQKLYGARRRMPVDASGEPCTRAALTDDGMVLITAGMSAQGWFDPDGRQVESRDIGACDGAGNALEIVPSTLGEAQPRQLPRSEPVRRQVWTKAGKGSMAVLKLLVWKSCKEEAWPGWPAWLVHFTDYSPDRKTPLERTLRTARSEAEANAVADSLITENIKKGWEEVALPTASKKAAPTKQETGKTASKKTTARKTSTKKP
jgi:hypothetical protein